LTERLAPATLAAAQSPPDARDGRGERDERDERDEHALAAPLCPRRFPPLRPRVSRQQQEIPMTDALSPPNAGGPTAPPLPWAPDIPVRHVTVDGMRIRYLVVGSGPTLVLLHTLRTQLDMFQKVIPELATRFRVYALDYPGHGHSDAPGADYAAEFFVASVAGVLDRLNIQDAVLAGESIGGTIALLLAARRNPRVRGVVAVNPYDYDRGRGLRRSSALANLFIGMSGVPLIGGAMGRMQPYSAVKRILLGGVYRKDAFPSALLRELYTAGTEPGHPRAFMQLVRHWPSWEQARAEYGNIALPVLLLYGDHDWSRDAEREADQGAIPASRIRVVKDAGHFLALDAPSAFVQAVVDLEAGLSA
jgi:pimeloyl-ACP methyl ester carboxylesterase